MGMSFFKGRRRPFGKHALDEAAEGVGSNSPPRGPGCRGVALMFATSGSNR